MDGERLKEEGISRATEGRETLLQRARDIAVRVASERPGSKVSIDDVRDEMGEDFAKLGMGAGAVFRVSCFTHVGWVKSRHAASHARPISVWRYIG